MATPTVDLGRVAALKQAEDQRFAATHPRSLALRERARASMPLGVPLPWMSVNWDHPPLFVAGGDGSYLTDVDGHRYLDVSLGITVASAGHTPASVIAAVSERMASGTQFHLPTEDAIWVSEELARRWGLPKWQFQLSASQAITDAVRLARARTGRERILLFEGKYQGHVSELLAVEGAAGAQPEYHGVTRADIARTTLVDWNDVGAAAQELARGDVAVVLVEPALTNSGIVFPSADFHTELRGLTRDHGTLLVLDETQTLPMAYGGLKSAWDIACDMVVLGKSLGGGVPVAALGMSDEIAALIDHDYAPYEVMGAPVDEPGVGGTLFGNALSMAAAQAALSGVWTHETYERTSSLARAMATALEGAIRERGRDWDVYHVGNRVGYRFDARSPRNNREAAEYDIPPVRHLQRVFMANRGVWEFGWWGGPAISAQTGKQDVDLYTGRFEEFAETLLG
jgi:glutamate-1-semialdehyde 2,1-aminomutase